jgi:membrane-bound ClpP family serine protease
LWKHFALTSTDLALDEDMDSQFWAVALAILGFALIVAEFFVPSGGVIALSCAGSFVGSVVCAHSAWYQSSPKLFWTFTLGLGVLIPSFLVFFLRTLERTSLGNNLLLPRTDPKDVTPYQAEAEQLDRLVGRIGMTVTPMNLGGMVRVENERLHAISEGFMLAAGEPIEVIGVQGNRLIVKRTSPRVPAPPASLAEPENSTPPESITPLPVEPERLDFDVPQD